MDGFLLTLRRYLVLAALFFWQGGFTFYASVVVPIGQEELHGHLEQGFITRRVTVFLNLSGAVALPVLAWELTRSRDPSLRRRWFRIGLWLFMLLTLAALQVLHQRLDLLLDVEYRDIIDRKAFGPGHRLYLWISTIQWAGALVYLFLSLQTWRAEDRMEKENVQPSR